MFGYHSKPSLPSSATCSGSPHPVAVRCSRQISVSPRGFVAGGTGRIETK
jgi:hypothetical protein